MEGFIVKLYGVSSPEAGASLGSTGSGPEAFHCSRTTTSCQQGNLHTRPKHGCPQKRGAGAKTVGESIAQTKSIIQVYNPYAPIPSASSFGVGFGYLNTF